MGDVLRSALRSVRRRLGFLEPFVERLGWKRRLADTYYTLLHAAASELTDVQVGANRLTFRVDSRRDTIRYATLMGERPVLTALLSELSGQDVFWDVGAHTGLYSCFVADQLGPGHVVAFEPHPGLADRLRANLALNQLSAAVLPLALSDDDETAILALPEEAEGEGEYVVTGTSRERPANQADGIPISLRRGDSIAEGGTVPPPSILKIDVEGAEARVLSGLRSTLRSERLRTVYCEVHPGHLSDFGDDEDRLRAMLSSLGFSLSTIHSRTDEYFLRASRTSSPPG